LTPVWKYESLTELMAMGRRIAVEGGTLANDLS